MVWSWGSRYAAFSDELVGRKNNVDGLFLATSPYYPKGNPTGSSSGSGTGIAIGLATVALGTETDGSIMSPSSRNNVVSSGCSGPL